MQITFPDMVPVDFQLVVPDGALRAQDNELIFSMSGDGTIDIGDTFILYTCRLD